ncbi:pimeloyl-ACP methyl ester carboxylesterase [Kitasatospora sp. SolWspMP-SS2h]|uniref:alpha/beta fold hydrolase n=1 Tax=Kitasatospora sp. SolWspMP-SS2h TaxID=1305729 RepID=UPI000DB8FAB4|nr:alpha/beta hydrolase [Kitasatospora sp. SolWspMP-SS2h]RAJ46847.1 pimeloyl-ACP methyl ester carboxylesterase [Kitasatospora sp. SolWspMP-SS2h]
MTAEQLLTEAGTGRPVLLLHGGGGPATVAPLAARLARTAHVLTPVHPGWDGTERPAALARIADLAEHYLDLLRLRGLRDVLVVGSSLGGWIGAEMALRDTGTGAGGGAVVGGLVLIDAVGIRVDGEPLTDVFALDARGLAEHSWHDPDRHFVDPATLPPAELARRRSNLATMRALAGDPYMHDPGLRERLGDVRVPVLVLWGESDRVATPGYGAAYARAFPAARFAVVPGAGHLPHLEQPEAVLAHLDAELDGPLRTG